MAELDHLAFTQQTAAPGRPSRLHPGEGEHDGSAFELVGEANLASSGIRQLEARRSIAGGERVRKRHGREARLLFGEALLDAGADRFR